MRQAVIGELGQVARLHETVNRLDQIKDEECFLTFSGRQCFPRQSAVDDDISSIAKREVGVGQFPECWVRHYTLWFSLLAAVAILLPCVVQAKFIRQWPQVVPIYLSIFPLLIVETAAGKRLVRHFSGLMSFNV